MTRTLLVAAACLLASPVTTRRVYRRLPLSVFAALACIAICIGLFYAFRTRYCTATATFQIASLLDDDVRSVDRIEYERFKNTQIRLIKSYFVLQSAFRDPGIASLSIFAGKEDPVTWMQESIEVEFPEDSDVMAISLRADRTFDNDVRYVVDAVAKAYQEEVLDIQTRGNGSLPEQMQRVLQLQPAVLSYE